MCAGLAYSLWAARPPDPVTNSVMEAAVAGNGAVKCYAFTSVDLAVPMACVIMHDLIDFFVSLVLL